MANIDYTLLGNLIAEPYFKTFNSGNAVLRFRVATSDVKKEKNDNGDDVWQDYNQFYVDVECWGQLAVNAGASLRKGFPVIVIGKLVHEYWEGKDDKGEVALRSKTTLKARHVAFDLARYQVNSVRTSASGNTLEGHEMPKPMDAKALNRKLNGEDADDTEPKGGWGSFADTPEVEERRVSAEDVDGVTRTDADTDADTDRAGEELAATGGAPF
ncbi:MULTISPECIES: single-stranded DNA-binding protein [unclassified Corynebacterium]|uniref:single-stranded DNA-binding protein n=1 Tax=unclassified Corynebacterium TaxID=2624378 RepID=UPI001EF6AA8C|nr:MULTISPECIES: single-stranded DNA-binding protein [unclassified Corynebacterium]MCG7290219.1 single-stranded DNA-binding protein [Corynebacterium sp. ACRPZ]MCG7294273.1 single-stranded DNA-binding protein [Corynebacterium sp. ACRPY]